MSIRFRLTLLYSAILALTLAVFSAALYSLQARGTLNALRLDLHLSSEKLIEAFLHSPLPHSPEIPAPAPRPPQTFDQFSGEPAFQDLREREIVRILDANGNLIASPFGRVEDALPLTPEGLAALQNLQPWWEESAVGNEHMLIYSRPIAQNGEMIAIVQVARSLMERDRTLRSLALTLGGGGLLTSLFAFGVGWALSGASLRPINRITQTAQAIGEERNFTRRVAYRGPQDEVGRLANTFNQMLTSLQEAYQKVEHALQMQRNFVADVSHELRTPLTTLRGNLGLLNRALPPAEQADILADMVDESDRLIRLVNDLLLLARADAGRSLAKDPLEIAPLLAEAVRQAHLLDPAREITLNAPAELTILGDRDAFKQVLLILLDNAFKHSEGAVEVGATAQPAQAEIWVRDYGAGMDAETLAHIFDRFYRGEAHSVTPGFGLGLPIAKALVTALGGSISVQSQPGAGSEVRLRFAGQPEKMGNSPAC